MELYYTILDDGKYEIVDNIIFREVVIVVTLVEFAVLKGYMPLFGVNFIENKPKNRRRV